jgi:hypothetical protein
MGGQCSQLSGANVLRDLQLDGKTIISHVNEYTYLG